MHEEDVIVLMTDGTHTQNVNRRILWARTFGYAHLEIAINTGLSGQRRHTYCTKIHTTTAPHTPVLINNKHSRPHRLHSAHTFTHSNSHQSPQRTLIPIHKPSRHSFELAHLQLEIGFMGIRYRDFPGIHYSITIAMIFTISGQQECEIG